MTTSSRERKIQRKGRWRFEILAFLALLVFVSGLQGQQRNATGAKAEAPGSLRVTLTVQSSVGIVMDKDGQPQVIVANAPDVRDGVAYMNEAGRSGSPGSQESANNQDAANANRHSPAQELKANQAREVERND